MYNQNETYMRITAEDDNEYVCPLSVAQSRTPLKMSQLNDCVEAEVVGRYIGNLNIVGRD